jgi:3-phenylpropionate/trans-cinnamate dioxygenase ferredoxin reductase subunit
MRAGAGSDQAVVIVGAGLAGGTAAVTLREEGWRGRIVLLGAELSIPFGRPPLSKTYLRGEEDLSAWQVKSSDWYDDQDIELHTEVSVQRVDPAHKQVLLASGGAVGYETLVLCTGATNRPLATPGATLPGVFQLRTVAEWR